MNSAKKTIIAILSLILFKNTFFAESKPLTGLELCNRTWSFLSANKLKPVSNEIISSSENAFPYNIAINYKKKDSDSNLLIITFKMEEAFEHQDILLSVIKHLSKQEFSSEILLLYGTEKLYPSYMTVNSADTYAKNLDTTTNNIVLNVKLSSSKNEILCGSNGNISPAWLFKNLYNAYKSQGLTKNLPSIYISQLYKYKFTENEILSAFLKNEIPAVNANFNAAETDSNTISLVINNFIDNYDDNKNASLDYHSIIFNFKNKTLVISESATVTIIIILLFMNCALVFILAYVYAGIKSRIWKDIKNDWYILPVTFILTLAGLYAGRGFFILFNPDLTRTKTVFSIVLLQISFAAAFNSIFYLIEIFFHKKLYTAHSIDFIILIMGSLNLIIFCLHDISLFMMFLFVLLINILCIIMKRNWFHIFMWFIMFLPYLPYLVLLYKYTDSNYLQHFLTYGKFEPLTLTFILLPPFLMFLRILTAVKKRFEGKLVFSIIISASYIFIVTSVILLNSLAFKKHSEIIQTTIFPTDNQELINVDYHDKNIYGEKVRTIRIKSKEDIEVVEIKVIGEKQNPVLYSDYDYETLTKSSSVFIFPSNPSRNLSVTFGTNNLACTILVEALYKTENENEFLSCKKSITIKDKS